MLLIGLAVMFFATAPGAGVCADTAIYFGTAENLAAGHGLTASFHGRPQAWTSRPPPFPAFLAVMIAAGMPVFSAARWLIIILYAVKGVLVFHLV